MGLFNWLWSWSIRASGIKLRFFCGGRGLNLKPYIYYALSLSIELNSREQSIKLCLRTQLPYRYFDIFFNYTLIQSYQHNYLYILCYSICSQIWNIDKMADVDLLYACL